MKKLSDIQIDGTVSINVGSASEQLEVGGKINATDGYQANGTDGYTGTITINQPDFQPQINIDVEGGIITNVY